MRPAALVTGGADRIGAAFVEALAADGYDVALHHRGRLEAAEATAARAREQGAQVVLVRADLTVEAERAGLVAAAAEALGRPPSVLVNNASLFRFDDLASLEPALWREHLEANLTAPVFLIRDFARALGDGEGVVVNLLDQKVNRPNPDFLSYTASRMGLAGLTAPLALALAPRVRLAGIAPGLTLPSQVHPDSDFGQAQSSAPLRRGPTPADLVAALRFILATPSFTGQIVTVDGGESLVGRPRDMAFDQARYD